MYIISRNCLSGTAEELWSTDNTRSFWQITSKADFDKSFIKQFPMFSQAVEELSSVIKPNYLNNFKYKVKNMKENAVAMLEGATCWVIRKTNIRTGKAQYLGNDTSMAFFSDELSGNFTRKYYSLKAANEDKQNYQAQTIRSVYKFDIVEFNVAAKEFNESDNGNYEDKKMSPVGVGLK